MSCWYWGGPWFLGFRIISLFFFIMMIVFCFRMIRHARWRVAEGGGRADGRSYYCRRPWRGWMNGTGLESSREILDRRYAAGEIDLEEYRRMKKEIDRSVVDQD